MVDSVHTLPTAPKNVKIPKATDPKTITHEKSSGAIKRHNSEANSQTRS